MKTRSVQCGVAEERAIWRYDLIYVNGMCATDRSGRKKSLVNISGGVKQNAVWRQPQ